MQSRVSVSNARKTLDNVKCDEVYSLPFVCLSVPVSLPIRAPTTFSAFEKLRVRSLRTQYYAVIVILPCCTESAGHKQDVVISSI